MLTSEHPFWSGSFIFTPFVDFNLSYRIVALATHWRNQMLRGSARGGGGWWRIKWIYYRLLAGWLWNLRKPSFNLRLKLESWSPVSQVPGLLLTSAQLVSDSRPGNSPAPPRPAQPPRAWSHHGAAVAGPRAAARCSAICPRYVI